MAEYKVAAENRKARHNYFIDDTLEAGVMLVGTEVKSLREGRSDISESYASERGGELWLVNAYIPEYSGGNRFNHETRRPRKLLLHKGEILRLIGKTKESGLSLVPLSLYFSNGRAKVEIALGRGRKAHDKRAAIKERDWQREKQRILRSAG